MELKISRIFFSQTIFSLILQVFPEDFELRLKCFRKIVNFNKSYFSVEDIIPTAIRGTNHGKAHYIRCIILRCRSALLWTKKITETKKKHSTEELRLCCVLLPVSYQKLVLISTNKKAIFKFDRNSIARQTFLDANTRSKLSLCSSQKT